MSGRRPTPAHLTYALLATMLLAGGTYLGLAKQGGPTTPPAAMESSTSPTPEPTRPPAPLSRDLERSAPAAPSPAPTRNATVTSSGSCGASYYHEPQGTANGETFDPDALTAAHKTLPFNSLVRVTNPTNGKSVTVRINDRGPYIDGRCLDLSRAAFATIADLGQGVLNVVSFEVLKP
jgi:rare lipoprotein A